MGAVLENASDYINSLDKIAAAAGSVNFTFNPSENRLILSDVEQSVVDALAETLDDIANRPSADQVIAEGRRRKRLLVGAPDAESFNEIVIAGMQEATDLLDIKTQRDWTTEEADRAEELRQLQNTITLFDSIAAAMSLTRPANYQSDTLWQPQTI